LGTRDVSAASGTPQFLAQQAAQRRNTLGTGFVPARIAGIRAWDESLLSSRNCSGGHQDSAARSVAKMPTGLAGLWRGRPCISVTSASKHAWRWWRSTAASRRRAPPIR